MSDLERRYLHDVVFRIRERAEEAALEEDDLGRGRALAFAEVLAIMQNDAVGFDMRTDDLGLDIGEPFALIADALARAGKTPQGGTKGIDVMTSEQRVEFPGDFEDYAWEVKSKGWFQGAVAVIDGRRYRMMFYDPGRLSQDAERELLRGVAFFFEPNLVVVSSVTREHMEAAVLAIVASGQHTDLKPE